ncbi:MAG: hypothetical protein PHQ40_13895 [Anaerolineaceae bacterium]|nr:hypothetical protein [Anaerolineaceae bacterium]
MDPWSYEYIRRHQIEVLEWVRREQFSKRVMLLCPTWKPSFRLQLANALIRLGLWIKTSTPGTPAYPGGCAEIAPLSLRNP